MKHDSAKNINVMNPRHGITWLMQAIGLLRVQPARLLLMAILLQIIMGLTQVPVLGFLVIVSVPALSAGLLQAFHITGTGGQPAPLLLFTAFLSGKRSGRFFAMGALVFIVGVLTVSLVLSGSEELFNPETLARIEQGDLEAMAEIDQDSLRRIVLALLLGVGVSGTLSYFTIPLMWFRDYRLGAALRTGIRALVANWKPFMVLGLALFALMFPLALVGGILFSVAGSGGLLSVLIMAVVMILLLAFQLVLFGTQYCAFVEIFGLGDDAVPPPSGEQSQLVA